MKLIVAGGRDIDGLGISWLTDILFHLGIHPTDGVTEIVSGGARGIDSLGENWAKGYANGLKIQIFPADWDRYGRGAGPMRNKEMAEYADILLLIWDGESRGSSSMKRNMEKLNKKVFEVILKK